jgi:predicted nucleotidyltransferase
VHPVIAKAQERLGVSLPNLAAAAETAAAVRQDIRERLKRHATPTTVDVVVFGSLAREEVTQRSDVDYVVVAHSLPDKDQIGVTRDLLQEMDDFCHERLAPPGATGVFGRVLSAPGLTERIGLEGDTNANHTRRILLLEESASVLNDGLHERLIRAILERYLFDYRDHSKSKGAPRFLLNDICRYWRTIAVDYQAKRWERFDRSWGLRYLKLVISRKLVYAGALASLLRRDSANLDYLYEQFRLPSLARLAQLVDDIGAVEDLGTILRVADEFVGELDDDSFRSEMERISGPAEFKKNERATRFKKRAEDLQQALERVFFDTEVLGAQSRRYLSF